MMDLMVVEVVAKDRTAKYLMESEKRRVLKLAGVTNWWGKLVAHVFALATQNQQLAARCCTSVRTASCC